MSRDEHIADSITFVWFELGVNLLPQGETKFVLAMTTLLDAAIDDGIQEALSTYEKLQSVSVN